MVFNNNKGFSGIIILIFVALFVTALISVVVGNSFNQLNTMIQSDSDLGNTSKTIVNDLNDRYDDTMDGVFITMLGLFFIVGMVASWYSSDNPYALIVAIVMMIFIIISGAVMSNAWAEYTLDAELGSYANNLSMTNFVMNNFLMFAFGMIGSMITVMYLRNR